MRKKKEITDPVELVFFRTHYLHGGISKDELRQEIELEVFRYIENKNNKHWALVQNAAEKLRSRPDWNVLPSVFGALSQFLQRSILSGYMVRLRRWLLCKPRDKKNVVKDRENPEAWLAPKNIEVPIDTYADQLSTDRSD